MSDVDNGSQAIWGICFGRRGARRSRRVDGLGLGLGGKAGAGHQAAAPAAPAAPAEAPAAAAEAEALGDGRLAALDPDSSQETPLVSDA